jgi:hypothetical protein
MRAIAKATLALMFLWAAPVRAWDGPGLWESPANGPQPGGGGVWGAGGKRDFGISCAHCHVQNDAVKQVDLQLTWNPPLQNIAGQAAYSPSKTYSITATMVNEHLGLSGCGPYTSNVNNFAVGFETGAGATAGTLVGDYGRGDACPPTLPSPPPAGMTTMTYGDCHALASSGGPGKTSWTFQWLSPAAGGGAISVHWGVVDGNCDMMSMADDVKVGTQVLVEGTVRRDGPRRSRAALALAALSLLGLGLVVRSGRRRR